MKAPLMISAAGLAAFVAGVAALHALEPGLSPARHVISEYANSGSGWAMTTSFAGWSVSLAAAAVVVGRARHVLPDARLRVATAATLIVSAASIILAATFPTQAVAGRIPPGEERTLTGALHDAGSGSATIALFAAAALTALGSERSPLFRRLSIAACVSGIVLNSALLAVGPEVGGVRQRLLVLVACAWQAAAITILQPRAASSERS